MNGLLFDGALVVWAFLWGGIPTGYIIVRLLKGVDIRKEGSGNTGATNVGRLLGRHWFFGVLLLDALKGVLPVLLGIWLISPGGPMRLIVAASTIGGSLFSPWLGFRGGKGIGTSLGALLALAPLPLGMSLLAFVAALLVSKYVSLASVIAAAVFPIGVLAVGVLRGLNHDPLLIGFSVLLALTIIAAHRSNISRILKGTEPRFR